MCDSMTRFGYSVYRWTKSGLNLQFETLLQVIHASLNARVQLESTTGPQNEGGSTHAQVVALVIVAIGSICVADVVAFPSCWNSCAVCPSCESCNSWSIVNAMRAQLRSVIVAMGPICVADVVVFPSHYSFMDARVICLQIMQGFSS
jgi:hypothetical protein